MEIPGSDDAVQVARDEMAEGITRYVIEPIALLSGVLAHAATADETIVDIGKVGYLLGLVVHGAKEEIEIHRKGANGACMMEKLLEELGVKPDWESSQGSG